VVSCVYGEGVREVETGRNTKVEVSEQQLPIQMQRATLDHMQDIIKETGII
jgi:hypothetical protein